MGQGLGCVGLGMISFQREKTLETKALWLTVCVRGNDHLHDNICEIQKNLPKTCSHGLQA